MGINIATLVILSALIVVLSLMSRVSMVSRISQSLTSIETVSPTTPVHAMGVGRISIEGDTLWNPRVTIKVTLNLTTLDSGDYLVGFVTASGVAAGKDFTV